ncbi:Acetyl-CoA synthase corrinoid iron-sulfur protein, large subunit [Lachnospiraceae bacterium TWA4]|nr:Acetyl-CoA synthase corrinoid iron-sulfur protein, large subunit [Lachnospiraceae bacterium TWA4]
MALTGIQIFKLTPKKNCKECGCPTCMAFSMKVASGALTVDKCPHMSDEALAQLSEATAPPMKSITIGTGDAEHKLGGETVLFRHEKTLVSRNLFAVNVTAENVDAKLAEIPKVDYVRIGERMYVELVNVKYTGEGAAAYAELVKKVMGLGRTLVLEVSDVDAAKAALEVCKDAKPILNGANPANAADMNAVATEAGVVLGVSADDLNALYDTVAELEKAGNKNLVLDCGSKSVKDVFGNAVQIRRAALKDEDRTFGYPSIVNLSAVAGGDQALQAALASVFTLKYGSIIVMDEMNYAQALALYGLRQNIYTDPQKPMKVEPGIYPLNGADENSVCVTTVDFALTYFVVSGELERSGVPCNLLISDAGGMSVLTAWAAGKLTAGTIANFINEEVAGKIKNRTLIIPGKVAVLKGELEAKLPDWDIVVGTQEAVQIVKAMREYA